MTFHLFNSTNKHFAAGDECKTLAKPNIASPKILIRHKVTNIQNKHGRLLIKLYKLYILYSIGHNCDIFLRSLANVKKRLTPEVNMCVCPGENEDEKLNEVMYDAWRFNRDCKQLRDGLPGLSWDGQYQIICSISGK